MVIHNAYYLDKQIHTFRNELLNIPGVTNATISGDLPTGTNFDNEGWFRDASLDATKAVVLTNFYVDENYVPTLGMEMKQGRNFSKDFPTDSPGVILNEAAVKVLGYKDPFKETIYRPNFYDGGIHGALAYHVVGVVKDFNFSSMHQSVGPLIIQLGDNWGALPFGSILKTFLRSYNAIESKWTNMVPTQPFNYTFMDADFNNVYTAEQQTGTLFITFAVFAILIGCLGLFGLVTYAAEQRTKEIGVRKVLGASVSGIVTMLSKDFAKLVLIASLIAFPIAWWGMHKWLQSFAYRITISWWVFIVAAAAARNCDDNSQLPGDQGSHGQPCEELENRVSQVSKLGRSELKWFVVYVVIRSVLCDQIFWSQNAQRNTTHTKSINSLTEMTNTVMIIMRIILPLNTRKHRGKSINNSAFLCIKWRQNTINLISRTTFPWAVACLRDFPRCQ